MKRRWTLAIIAANLLALVALVFIYPHLMVSPGPLVSAHAALTRDCFACHAPLRGAAADRCIECHAVTAIGLRSTTGAPIVRRAPKPSFHQALIEPDCMACHSDHRTPLLTHRLRKPFAHALLRPAVAERCEQCHAAPPTPLHRGVTGNCQQCHGTDHWTPATFDHDRLFVLEGDHKTACVTCHTGGDFRRHTCFGCHEHQPDKVRKEHLEEGIRDIDDCVACHRSASDRPTRQGSRQDRRAD